MGVTGNDVSVNNKGGTTCDDTKQLLQGSLIVFKFCHSRALKAMDPVLTASKHPVFCLFVVFNQ